MSQPLIAPYAGLVCDLDGVVYAGPSAIRHAVDSLSAVRSAGYLLLYATNNASRPPREVAGHLRDLGITCTDDEVVNSSMAGAHLLSRGVPGHRVLAVGGEGVSLALSAAGLQAVSTAERRAGQEVDAVLQGYGSHVEAQDLAEVAYAIQAGARWVATNTDKTLPTDRGQAPGNGSLVAAVRWAVDHDPVVAGKPEPTMYQLAAERMGLSRRRVLAVGDRLETDIQGAVSGGYDSVLVLTGVHGWPDAAAAPRERRPTYVIQDLRGLHEPYRIAGVSDLSALPEAPSDEELRKVLELIWEQVDAGEMTSDEARQLMLRVLPKENDGA